MYMCIPDLIILFVKYLWYMWSYRHFIINRQLLNGKYRIIFTYMSRLPWQGLDFCFNVFNFLFSHSDLILEYHLANYLQYAIKFI